MTGLKKTKKYWRWLFSFGWCLVLLLLPEYGACAEPTYLITESEMEQLDNNWRQLERINKDNQQELWTLKEQLKTSNEQTTQLVFLLDELKRENEQQKQLLQTAEQSFNAYVKEERSKANRKNIQNICWGVIGGGIITLACKQ